jgi:hypothetical protein
MSEDKYPIFIQTCNITGIEIQLGFNGNKPLPKEVFIKEAPDKKEILINLYAGDRIWYLSAATPNATKHHKNLDWYLRNNYNLYGKDKGCIYSNVNGDILRANLNDLAIFLEKQFPSLRNQQHDGILTHIHGLLFEMKIIKHDMDMK